MTAEDDTRIVYRNKNVVVVSEFIEPLRFNTSSGSMKLPKGGIVKQTLKFTEEFDERIVLAKQMCVRFQIQMNDLMLIEHTYDQEFECYIEIQFTIVDGNGRFFGPFARARVVSKEFVDDMMLNILVE